MNAAMREAQDQMKQPGVIIIGRQFFLKIDTLPIEYSARLTSFESALSCLISLIYILNVNYPEPLKFVFAFFEHLFDFQEKSLNSANVTNLFSIVMPEEN